MFFICMYASSIDYTLIFDIDYFALVYCTETGANPSQTSSAKQ